ncbi:S24 family peptidase [Escherichia coli]|jgi:phage repressor protein C with HTH and peptisase S24 domain|uniref:XRE family transcriptional regulator n=3 Tax=Escherichia coli TaxID=562 RepID=A0A7B3IIJ6_ECOLX|nr:MULTISPECIES: S24 family peptidase [Enterobacteriaceae]HDW3848286.1 helix-turn-helix transcriptional regulator [Escherichia coli O100:H12]ASA61244.1 phage repressor protein [Escherichia coli]ASA66675.1 phage repressor protein [Escherichia coli]EAC2024850.1 helix-turn-helix transcriptional regulator [Escherichia coli]EEV5934151.1 helix-turn-helix transcriptional regulator [Escherichia coli]
MDKYEQRRLRLIEIRDRFCNGKASELARRIEREPSYVSRMLYPEGKSGKKRIADDMMELIEKSFNLPRGWMDMLADGKAGATDHLEFAGNVRAGFVPVIGEAVLGVDGSVDMIEFRSGWLSIYSGDNDAYGLKVKGDSMWPRIQSGEYVVIEPNTPVHPGDEVFVRTKDGHNMIKIMNKTRDGDYQFSSINSDHRPITLPVEEVDKMHFVSAIVKHTRYVDQDDLPKV